MPARPCRTLVLFSMAMALAAADSAPTKPRAPAKEPAINTKPAASNLPSVRQGAISIDYGAAAASPAYDKASASEPLYTDKALWPNLVGKEAYVSEKWSPGRTLVWAKPGTNGAVKPRNGGLAILDPANWLENGKPASELWDEDTAIVLPPSPDGKDYEVGMSDAPKRQEFRHLTVGRGANFLGGGDGLGRQVHGNVWVKKGGRTGVQGATSLVGHKHSFFRNDNPLGSKLAGSQYFSFDRGPGSVEFLGHITCGDEFMVNSGTVVVGVDSILQAGRSCRPYVSKSATLVLMDNAWWGTWANTWNCPDLEVRGGTIQAGLPERPIRRSAYLGLSWKNYNQAVYEPGTEGPPGMGATCPRVPSLLLRAGSTLRSYTKDAKTAKLVLREAGYFTIYIEGGSTRLFPYDGEYGFWNERAPKIKHKYDWFDAQPKGVDLFAEAGVTISDVEFDGFRQGGIMTADATLPTAWKNLSFTKANAAQGTALFAVQPKVGGDGSY